MSYICTQAETPAPVVRVLAELAYCCMGAAEDGPSGCTCWEPVYDLEDACMAIIALIAVAVLALLVWLTVGGLQ